MAPGCNSGDQIEGNRAQLRATETALDRRIAASTPVIAPAGGRAVAGSNPVSPITKCLQMKIAALLVRSSGVQLSAQFWTPNSPPLCRLALRGGSRPTTARFRAGWSQVAYDPGAPHAEARQGPEHRRVHGAHARVSHRHARNEAGQCTLGAGAPSAPAGLRLAPMRLGAHAGTIAGCVRPC